jgi:putative DNA methylase
MAKGQPWKDKGMKKAEWLADEVAKAVGAGKPWDCETVNFSDPDRPPTCIEVDFPILPINQIAAIEGNAGKPIYQMSKWWARRRSSVFRAILLASAIKAPDDPSEAAKLAWNAYYGNHQKKGAFKHLKVADIFMGGGTTIVEGSRLGMQMYGNDLNPVAWFIVKNEMAQVDKKEVEALLADIEAEVKPQIMPFYTCDCPRGHKGKWTHIPTEEIMEDDFDPLSLTPEGRKQYQYEGPEIIYVFWAKHGPCQVTGCGHRTPIMSSPVMAVKTISVKTWVRKCEYCGNDYDLEEREARMAPGVPLVVAETERPYAVLNPNRRPNDPESTVCPFCGKMEKFKRPKGGKRKKVGLSLLVHPQWLQGEPGRDENGRPHGGSTDDHVEDTIRWNQARAAKCRLVEVRGKLPDQITCPETGMMIKTGRGGGTVPKKSHFACGACGKTQNILTAVKASGKNGPVAMYAIQGYCPECDKEGQLYGGRFFIPVSDTSSYDSALYEWESTKNDSNKGLWPKSELSKGWKTHGWAIPEHGFTHYWKMFNPRQLLVHAKLLDSITKENETGLYNFILGAYQQYLRNQNMFCFWDVGYDKLCPHLSNNNYHPKAISVENGVFASLGRGNWRTQYRNLLHSIDWANNPWEMVSNARLAEIKPTTAGFLNGKSEKTQCDDPILHSAELTCCSSTDLSLAISESYDFVVTDPPFGGIMQYAELGDFFYVWLRLALKDKYPQYFSAEFSPKLMEAVSNPYRNSNNPDEYYARLLTECWREAYRILRPAGILAFTFHHREDKAWVAVLESLFEAGFCLEATYPVLSDESKGDRGQFGSQEIEYDVIHVCRKRYKEPTPISWAKLRRQVLRDVSDLQELLEHHQKEGLPEADLQVIRRGKALEHFSKHYGKVYKDQGAPMTVLEAVVGTRQLLDEEMGGTKEPAPHNAEPFTRMLLRLFDGIDQLPRDQIQKFLRGTGSAPYDYVSRGWIYEKKKVFYLTPPLSLAQSWFGKKRKGMTSDYDQTMFFIGACFERSGIRASDTFNNPNFKPHPALGSLLLWFKNHGADSPVRNAAITASELYHNWEARNQPKLQQLKLFENIGEEEF